MAAEREQLMFRPLLPDTDNAGAGKLRLIKNGQPVRPVWAFLYVTTIYWRYFL